MGLWGFLRWDVWMNVIKSVKTGNEGNLKGDGTLLGGVYVIGAGDQGVLYHHQEQCCLKTISIVILDGTPKNFKT